MDSNWGSKPPLTEAPDPHLSPPTSFLPNVAEISPPTIDPAQNAPAATFLGGEAAGEAKPKRASSGIHGEPGPAPQKASDLKRLLIASRLLEERQIDEWYEKRGNVHFPDCASFARALVKDKLLTPYQAEVLTTGHTRGLVLGKYEILKPLGEGGMGAVFRARHRRMKREVALKVLPRELVKSPEAVHRFHREVQAAAKLHHPNIAAAYDADEEDGIYFLVMELVEGPDLANYVAEAGELPAPVAVQLTIQAARGLAHAHLQGVVHRDIKPANLVVNIQGTLKILDMGLAQLKAMGDDGGMELTHMGQAMGTIDYMAPEQAIDAHSVDHRADIYSLGCTLYYLLAGKPISPEGSMVQKLLWHQSAKRPSLRDVCSDATERLDMIFQHMVEADRERRYDKMRDVVEDLERVLPELRLGDAELPLIGDDMALYIGLEANEPHGAFHPSTGPSSSGSSAPALHATMAPQKSLAAEATNPAAAAMAMEQQLASAAIMIGKEVSAELSDGRTIRGIVNRLSIDVNPKNPQQRSVRLHIGSDAFALYEIREVFSGNGSVT